MKTLWFRRTPDTAKVREALSDIPPVDPPLIQTAFGETIVQLRRDIQYAINALDRGDTAIAQAILTTALEGHGQ